MNCSKRSIVCMSALVTCMSVSFMAQSSALGSEVEELIQQLESKNREERLKAILRLAKRAKSSSKAMSALAKKARSDDPFEKMFALGELQRLTGHKEFLPQPQFDSQETKVTYFGWIFRPNASFSWNSEPFTSTLTYKKGTPYITNTIRHGLVTVVTTKSPKNLRVKVHEKVGGTTRVTEFGSVYEAIAMNRKARGAYTYLRQLFVRGDIEFTYKMSGPATSSPPRTGVGRSNESPRHYSGDAQIRSLEDD